MESPSLARDQALSLWSGSTNSKTLDYQRTPNSRGHQIVRELPHRQPPVYKTQHHSTASGILCKTLHSNNKTKMQTQSSADSLNPTHQIKKKNSPPPTRMQAKVMPYRKLSQTTGPTLPGQKPKGKKNSTLKTGKNETSNTIT